MTDTTEKSRQIANQRGRQIAEAVAEVIPGDVRFAVVLVVPGAHNVFPFSDLEGEGRTARVLQAGVDRIKRAPESAEVLAVAGRGKPN